MSNVLEVNFGEDFVYPELHVDVPLPFRTKATVINAWGTRLRLRSLIAMGHNERRMGGALGVSRSALRVLLTAT